MYITLVNSNCATSADNGKDLFYWRNNLFAGAIIYLLPLCLIALLPSLYWIFVTRKFIIAVVDISTITGMITVAFMPGISLAVRKIIFTSCIYAFSCAILYYIGLYGSGLVYLMAVSIFAILIFQTDYIFWPAWLNTAVCVFFGLARFFNWVPWSHDLNNSLGAYVAITSNIVFLSFLLAALIPRLFNGLQHTIDNEKRLTEEVNKQQQSLQQAMDMVQLKNVELEQFAWIASHDLKEPTRMVTNFMGLLKNKYGNQLDAKAHTYIDFAVDGGRRMQKMIDDLLELSRTARQNSAKETVNLNDILKEVQQNIFKLIEDNKAEIIVKTELPVLAVYRTDFIRLLQNLLINAIKFRKKETNPVINLNAAEKESTWLFSIEDNGIGIEKEKFERVFEIFARLHSQEVYTGTGIGLAICKKAAEYHGGRIWVESEEGKGSSFYFTIKK